MAWISAGGGIGGADVSDGGGVNGVGDAAEDDCEVESCLAAAAANWFWNNPGDWTPNAINWSDNCNVHILVERT